MRHFDKHAQAFEPMVGDFTRSYEFEIEGGLLKVVTLARQGRRFTVLVQYVDGAVTDATEETFEADGSIRISLAESGVYLTGSRALLAGRVRLRRTRFF